METLQTPLDPIAAPVLVIDFDSRMYLTQAATWAKFLAIIGFVACGFMVLAAFLMGAFFSTMSAFGNDDMKELPGLGLMSGGLLAGVYIGLALVYFFPCLYLLNFANKMQTALIREDQLALMNSFRYLKANFRFVGIFVIVVIVIYLLMFILFFITALV